MSHFYGTIQGNRGEATRCGTKGSGMETYCASWDGAIRCYAYVDEDGKDKVIVTKVPWHGVGKYKVLYQGNIGEEEDDECRILNEQARERISD